MDVRCLEKKDITEVKSLIEKIYKNSDCDMLDYNNFNILENSYYSEAAVCGEKIIGCGGIWNNRYHDNAAYISINVLKPFRNMGAGGKLLSTLESKRNRNNMQCAIKSDDESGINFAKSHCFKLVRKTFEPVYDLKRREIKDKDVSLPDGFFMCPVSMLNGKKEELLKLFKEVYDRNHTFNKVSKLSAETWRAIMYDSLYEHGSMVVLHENEIAAFSFLYSCDDKLKLELGVRGVNEKYKKAEDRLILSMLFTQMKTAKENGYEYISDEIDDCDSGAMVAACLSDLSSVVSFDTYLKKY